MKAPPLTWYRLRWPREVEPAQILAAIGILASSADVPVIIEAVGTAGHVRHGLGLPAGQAGGIAQQLRSAIPGLDIDAKGWRPAQPSQRAIELRLSSRRRPLRTDRTGTIAQALVTALSHVGDNEQLVLRWVLGRPRQPLVVPSAAALSPRESLVAQSIESAIMRPKSTDSELRSAIRTKYSESGWRVQGLIGVTATGRSRQRQLLRQVFGALRISEAPGARWWAQSTSPERLARTSSLRHPLRLNVSEVAQLASWPSTTTAELPIERLTSRPMAPSAAISSGSRIVADGAFPGKERPLALDHVDARRHLLVIGPSGSGKSTLLTNLVVQDMEDGRGICVIEPKSDLISDILARVPAHRLDDVVVFDPTDSAPIGLNPLAAQGRTPELIADEFLGTIHAINASSWGARTADVLANALLTLALTPGMTLAALPLLLSPTDDRLRRAVVGKLSDPFGLETFWSDFESWGPGGRATAVAPSMNKIRPFLRRDLRAVFGQANPKFDLRQLFTERKIVLVDLNRAKLGPEASALVGSAIISRLWQLILGRNAVPPERRHTVVVYADEFQEFVKTSVDFGDALAMSRGLGVGWVLSHQFTRQLDPALFQSVASNVQSKVAFRLDTADARVMSADSNLDPEDFTGLGAYECYLQLVAGGAVQPWCSGRTRPAVALTSDKEELRALSRQRYGTPREETEAALLAMLASHSARPSGGIGSRKRVSEAER